ncbi:MAG: pyridoxine 5'-phosphate synthase [Bacteroidales bacterium]|nr:pyridoxine 5'-phosphate synthase [Bacteroidales bacterium]MBR2298912.1 pyridoxine 5'-phosphate synthase [Bacteroidales bacterium]
MTRLSVNINKFATLRNARGGNLPDVVKAAIDCERYGAEGITVHPRPDERHIRYSDVLDLKPILNTEFNIEGNPIDSFMELVLKAHPAQVTLVPDALNVITSNAGWDTITHKSYLKEICAVFKKEGIRTSIFVDPVPEMVRHAADTGCDRVELYTEAYAAQYHQNREKAIEPYYQAALAAQEVGLGLNAGHDLNLDNLQYFDKIIPGLLEVSIGHALICDALYYGLESTISQYLRQLNKF